MMRGRWWVWRRPLWRVQCKDCGVRAEGFWRVHWTLQRHNCTRMRGIELETARAEEPE